ncbi:hypothetical protein [Acholeplasma granularum]|uniref:hypothetical protein n=1 Tax=Acholeplasma granularum TaxID=264635 RepID=UPI0004706B58|nr:hypothetical protein [Acholeplasma granularum]
MKKIITFSYVLLIIYTIYHLVFKYSSLNLLSDIFSMNVDPLILAVFNLLGMFPLTFLLFAITTNKLNKVDFIFLFLGFVLGGFAVAPYFIYKKNPKYRNIRVFKYTSFILMFTTIIIIIFGLILGNFQVYLNAFLNDSFIHIMTIDFIFMIFISPLILKPVSRYYLLGFMPIVGIYLNLALKDYDLKKDKMEV